MRILALDGASAAGAGFGLVERRTDGSLHGLSRHWDAGQGAAVRLPGPVAAALAASPRLDLVAVLVGPGSFTGLRATLALAHGIAAGLGIPVSGVSVGEALAPALVVGFSSGSAWPVWCVSQARRDRVFIETVDQAGLVGAPMAFGLDALPEPPIDAPVLVGDAQEVAGAVLEQRGLRWRPGPLRPDPVGIAAAALQRRDGLLAPRDAQPLYVDPPEARPSPPPFGLV